MTIKLKKPEVPVPATIRELPLTEWGYFKPWFVEADDFRVVDGNKAWLSVSGQACWICGKPFTPGEYALVGDRNSVNQRVYTEPPCHKDCAEYAMQVCPFILYPNAKRREANLEAEQTLDHSNQNRSVKINKENPGEYFVTVVSQFTYHKQKQVMTHQGEHVLEQQHWIGGTRQS